jgi:endonuclease/exonuclease/phosphatase family metal-dependent hydrolase
VGITCSVAPRGRLLRALVACARRYVALALVVLAMPGILRSQDTLQIAAYNLLNYSSSDTSRHVFYRRVIQAMNPDILAVEEIGTSVSNGPGSVTMFFNRVMNGAGVGAYLQGTFIVDPTGSSNAVFYKPSRVSFVSNRTIKTALRNINEFTFFHQASAETLRVYAVHLKASNTSSDSAARVAEVDSLRKVTNALGSGKHFLVLGDFNIYRSTEGAYVRLLENGANSNGKFNDALSMPGVWNNSAYAIHHTQSPRVRAFGGGATGGLDDRFDLILFSSAINNPGGINYVTGSMTAFGNDGLHYNDSINRLPNSAVADSVANALHYASDHLPIAARFVFVSGGAPSTNVVSVATGNWNAPSTWSTNAVPADTNNVTISLGNTVTINGSFSCAKLIVAGTLQYDGTTGRALSVYDDLTIASGGEFRASAPSPSSSTSDTLNVSGDFVNNGTFTPRVIGVGTATIAVVLVGAGQQLLSGSTATTNFYTLTLNKPAASAIFTPTTNIGFVSNPANALTLTRGIWDQQVAQTLVQNNTVTIGANASLLIGGTGSFSPGAATLIVNGSLIVSGGWLTVGNGNNRLEVVGGTAEFSGGVTTVNGRLTLTSGTTTISGAEIVVNPRGATSLAATSNVFEVAGPASISMIDGILTIVNPKTATQTGREVKITSGAGVKSFSGGTIYFGDGVSTIAGSDSGFVVDSAVPLPDVVLRTGGAAGRNVSLAAPLTLKSLTLESGSLGLTNPFPAGSSCTINGSLAATSGSQLVSGTGTVTMGAPTPAELTNINAGSSVVQFHHLTIDNPGGVMLSSPITVTGTLALGSNILTTQTNSVTVGQAASLTRTSGYVAGNLSKYATAGNPSLTFEIGDPASYRPVLVALTGVSTPGNLTVGISQIAGDHPSIATSGINPSRSVNRYWTLANLGTVFTMCDVTFSFTNDDVDSGSTPSLFIVERYAGGSWTSTSAGVRTATSTQITGQASFGEFAIGEPMATSGLLSAGWNMLSLPVTITDPLKASVFPNSISNAYAYSGAGYATRDTLRYGEGFWLKFPVPDTVTLSGTVRERDTIYVSPGWNLIGTITDPVSTSSIVQIPSEIVSTPYYAYTPNVGYNPVTTLLPWKGYWVKVSQNGKLVLAAPASMRSIHE